MAVGRGLLATLEAKPGKGDELTASPGIRPIDILMVT